MRAGTPRAAHDRSSYRPADASGRIGGPAGEAGQHLGNGIGVLADPCQAARRIIEVAMRVVSSAGGGRLGLVRHPETAHLVEACHRGGVALPLDAPEQASGVLQQALVQREVVSLPDLAATACPDVSCLLDGPARSLLLAPVHAGALTLGLLALSASRPGAFSPQDGERLRALAAQAAAVLQYWARLLRAEADCEHAEAIMQALGEGLIVLDGAGHITRANRYLAELAAFPSGEISLPCAPDDPACPAALRTVLQPSPGTIIGPYEVVLETPAGERRTLRVSPFPLANPSLGELRLVRDVTAEREAAEAQALFISQVAHELRGPLQHIMGFTGLIRDFDDLPHDSYERFFRHIKDETDHLARLVDDLVELSRNELGRFAMRTEPTRLDTLVAEVIERLRPRSQLRGLSVSLHVAPEPLWACIDSLRITQVISNLVENALKFVPPGGAITVTVRPDGERHVLVSVADTGPGIRPEVMGRLFERFFQAHTDASGSIPGMGLGLYTCREIIRAHGGEIWAESEYGNGSAFHFRLDRVTP